MTHPSLHDRCTAELRLEGLIENPEFSDPPTHLQHAQRVRSMGSDARASAGEVTPALPLKNFREVMDSTFYDTGTGCSVMSLEVINLSRWDKYAWLKKVRKGSFWNFPLWALKDEISAWTFGGEEGPGGGHNGWRLLSANLVRSTRELVEDNALGVDLWRWGLPAGCGGEVLASGLEAEHQARRDYSPGSSFNAVCPVRF